MSLAEESCPSTLWQKLPFLPQPPTPGFNPSGWSETQYSSYAKSTILEATAVSIAFLGIAVVVFVFLLLWRLYGWITFCCSACCGIAPRLSRRKALLAYEVMHDPWLRGHKVAYGFFAVGCIVLAVMGLATLPRPRQQVDDLATRLETASAFTSSLLAASDGLLGSAADVRPAMSQLDTALERQGIAQKLESDMQCTSTFLDGGLARPATLRSQIAAVASALAVGLSPALTAMTALIDATMSPAPLGAKAALGVVEGMPDLVLAINSSLGSYDRALAALPTSRQPTSVSDLRVNTLQAAQNALDFPGWLPALDILVSSLRTVEKVATELLYTRVGAALKALQAAAQAALPPADTLAISLAALDTLYLGTPQQQQPISTVAGRACMLSLVQQLSDFDSSMFRFNSSLERSAIDTTLIVSETLEQIYGLDYTTAVGAGVQSDALEGTTGSGSVQAAAGMQLPTPLVTTPRQARQLLAPLAGWNGTGAAEQCDHVQLMLKNQDGTPAVPDLTPLLSYLATVRSTLVALQQRAGGVQAALAAYSGLPSEVLYGSLLSAVDTTKPYLSDARAAATPSLPPGSYRLALYAGNALLAANFTPQHYMYGPGVSVDDRLKWLPRNITNMTTWQAASDGGPATLNRTTIGLGVIQVALGQAQALLNQSGWGNVSRAAGSGGNSSSPSRPPPSPSAAVGPSTFLQPLLASMQLIASTLSDGITAVADQLDNALGKTLIASPPLPPSPSLAASPPPAARRRLQQISPGSDNATTVVRRQVVQRLDDLAAILRGKPVRLYSDAAYWSAVAVYGSIIAVCMLLGLALYFNCPAGMVAGLVVHFLLAVVVLAGAWAAAIGMVVAHDACGNSDSLVLEEVSPSSPLFPLVRYYLQGVGGSLASVLRTTGLGDTARLTAAADALQGQVLNPLLLPLPPDPIAFAINSTTPWPGSLGSVQYTLGALLVDLAVLAADVSTQLAALLTLGDRTAVLAQYGGMTSWACCGLGGQLLVAWVCATGCGLLAWLAGLSGLMVLKNLDDMPTGSRCGCTCYNPRNFPRPVRRRRYSSSNGGGGGVGCGGFGSEGGGAPRTTPINYPPPPLFINPPPVPRPYSASSRNSPSLRSQDVRASHGGGAAATATATLDFKGPPAPKYGKTSSPRALMVEGPLYQGPMPGPGPGSPRGSRPMPSGGSGSSPSATSRRPQGFTVNVCAMDPDIARTLGYGGSERGSGGGVPPQVSPGPSPRPSPRRPPPPPPAAPQQYRHGDWPA